MGRRTHAGRPGGVQIAYGTVELGGAGSPAFR